MNIRSGDTTLLLGCRGIVSARGLLGFNCDGLYFFDGLDLFGGGFCFFGGLFLGVCYVTCAPPLRVSVF